MKYQIKLKQQFILLGWLVVFFSFPLFSLSVNIRYFDHQDFTRLVFEGEKEFEYRVKPSQLSLELEIDQAVKLGKTNHGAQHSRLLGKVDYKKGRKKSTFTVHFKSACRIQKSFVLGSPYRVVFDLVTSAAGNRNSERFPSSSSFLTSEEQSTEEEEPQIPVLNPNPGTSSALDSNEETNRDQEGEIDSDNLFQEPGTGVTAAQNTRIHTICIDPGHGGSDLGAIGYTKILEKDITLKIARKLKRLIESKLGLRVVMTRTDDSEVSLDSRAALANNQKADMFISIHINGSYRRAASGSETFYVSLKATDQDAFRVAQEENKSFDEIEEMADENDQLKMILWNMAQTEYIKESSKLAEYIQNELNILLHTRNRGVKQAPFRVLMRSAMPAILIEVAFLSNAIEEKKLSTDSFLDETAYSIYNGVSKYIYNKNSMHNN